MNPENGESGVPNTVLTWAIDAAGGTGEEGEWNIHFPDVGHDAQVWADRDCGPDVAIVALWTLDSGIEQFIDLKPGEARQLAAALLCAASEAEDRVARWQDDNDGGDAA